MGIKPLIMSPMRVRIAANLFPVLNILVAPGFLEPNVLGSDKLNRRANMTENGIDPTI